MPTSPWSSSPTTPCCAAANCSPSPGATSTCRPTAGAERFGSGGRRPTKPAKALSRPSQNALFRHSPASSPPTPTPATEYSISHPKPPPAASEPQLKPPGSIPPTSPATPYAWAWPKTSPPRGSTWLGSCSQAGGRPQQPPFTTPDTWLPITPRRPSTSRPDTRWRNLGSL